MKPRMLLLLSMILVVVACFEEEYVGSFTDLSRDGPFITGPKGTTAYDGKVTFKDVSSNTRVTFQVENEKGSALSGIIVRFISDGRDYYGLVYDPSGNYLPKFCSGGLADSMFNPTKPAGPGPQSVSKSLSPDRTYAFDPFTITVVLIAVTGMKVMIDAVEAAGHFRAEVMFSDGSVITTCSDKSGLENSGSFITAVVSAKTGLIKTGRTLVVWAAKNVTPNAATKTLADQIFEGYDPDTAYRIEIMTTADGFGFYENTGEVCDPGSVPPAGDQEAEGDIRFHGLTKYDGLVGTFPEATWILPVMTYAVGTTGKIKWIIDWDDGTVEDTGWEEIGSSGKVYTHQYARARTYTVTVKLYWDKKGLMDSRSIQVTPMST